MLSPPRTKAADAVRSSRWSFQLPLSLIDGELPALFRRTCRPEQVPSCSDVRSTRTSFPYTRAPDVHPFESRPSDCLGLATSEISKFPLARPQGPTATRDSCSLKHSVNQPMPICPGAWSMRPWESVRSEMDRRADTDSHGRMDRPKKKVATGRINYRLTTRPRMADSARSGQRRLSTMRWQMSTMRWAPKPPQFSNIRWRYERATRSRGPGASRARVPFTTVATRLDFVIFSSEAVLPPGSPEADRPPGILAQGPLRPAAAVPRAVRPCLAMS
jgi:hypothetical protein